VALSALLLALVPASAHAQARVGQSTTFRKDPAGTVLATLTAGVSVAAGKAQGDWTAVTLEGWVYAASTASTTRDGFDIAIAAAGGENLRAAPNGKILARLETGALLDKVGTKGGWIQVWAIWCSPPASALETTTWSTWAASSVPSPGRSSSCCWPAW
jgi:hypothetical protein